MEQTVYYNWYNSQGLANFSGITNPKRQYFLQTAKPMIIYTHYKLMKYFINEMYEIAEK